MPISDAQKVSGVPISILETARIVTIMRIRGDLKHATDLHASKTVRTTLMEASPIDLTFA